MQTWMLRALMRKPLFSRNLGATPKGEFLKVSLAKVKTPIQSLAKISGHFQAYFQRPSLNNVKKTIDI